MSRMKELAAAFDSILADHEYRAKKASIIRSRIEARPDFPKMPLDTDEKRATLHRLLMEDPDYGPAMELVNTANEAVGQAINAVMAHPARSLMDLGQKLEVYWQCHYDDGSQNDNFFCFEDEPGSWLAMLREDLAMMAAEEQRTAIWLEAAEAYPEMKIEAGDFVKMRAFAGFSDDGPYAVLANRADGSRYIATMGEAKVRKEDGTLLERVKVSTCHFNADDKFRILSPHRVLGVSKEV